MSQCKAVAPAGSAAEKSSSLRCGIFPCRALTPWRHPGGCKALKEKGVPADAGRDVSHKKHKTMATTDLKKFNEWFSRMYERLKEKVSIHGRLDEDRFHDAYLAVRKQVMSSRDGIMDLESYFIGCYRRMAQVTEREDARTTYPGDEYFITLAEIDTAEESTEREELMTGRDRLVRDIQRFLRRHFSYGDYRMFMLRFYESGSSFRTIARHTGEKVSVLTRKAQTMLESLRNHPALGTRGRRLAAGYAA